MTLYYTWSADVVALGASLKIDVTDDGGAFTIELTSGVYNHEDISAVVSGHTTWAAALKTALEAGSEAVNPGSGLTYTVTYTAPTANPATTKHSTYNVKTTGTTLELDFSTAGAAYTQMASLLGYNATNHTGTGASTGYTSDISPYYTMVPEVAGRSQVDREFMPAGNAADAEADDGSAYSVMRGTSPRYWTWAQTVEPLAAVFEVEAAADPPWTWEHAWEHAGNVLPFLCNDGSERAIHRLRAVGAAHHPTSMAGDYHGQWVEPFATRMLGRL